MELKIDKEKCKLSDLKVPKGYRVIEDWELLKELRDNLELQQIFKNGIWVNRKEGILASWLNNGYDNSGFDAFGRYIDNCYRLRGVFVKNEIGVK